MPSMLFSHLNSLIQNPKISFPLKLKIANYVEQSE